MSHSLSVKFVEAIEWSRRRVALLPDDYYSQEGIARARTFTVSGLNSLSEIEVVLGSLQKALERGIAFKQWQELVKFESFSLLCQNQKERIFRTFLMLAYSAGRWEQQNRSTLRRYLMYNAVNDARTRPTHRALDGVIRQIDDPFWKTHYPINGVSCRCSVISLTEKQAEEYSKDGKGLNQVITAEMIPDLGWEYNPGLAFLD